MPATWQTQSPDSPIPQRHLKPSRLSDLGPFHAMSWIPLTLLCAFSLASADAATKRFFSDSSPGQIVVLRFVGTAIALAPLLLMQPWPSLPRTFWIYLTAMVPLEVWSMFLYMQAISTSPLAQTLPYLAFTPVCATLTGYLLLGETVSPRGFLGVLLVAVGAYGLNIDTVVTEGRSKAFTRDRAGARTTANVNRSGAL